MTGEANVVELFQRAANRRGDWPAIVGPEGRGLWSFGDLAERAAALAGGLTRIGLRPGDRVLVLEPDLGRRYAVVGAILWAGATVVVPATSASPWRAIAASGAAGPRAVVFGPALWPLVLAHPTLRSLPFRVATAGPRLPGFMSLAELAGPAVDPVAVDGATPALASFTTGSTGAPKLVLRSHDVLRAQHEALQRLRQLTEEDTDLVGLPTLVLHNLAAGVTSILPPAMVGAPAYGAMVRETIARTLPTSAAGFPHLFESAVDGAHDGELRSLRAVHVGGIRVSGELVRVLGQVAPAARVTVVYGSTEVEPIAAISGDAYLRALAMGNPTAGASAPGVCVGHVLDGVELRLEPDGRDAPVRGRAEGTISVRGERAAASPGEWVATGDIGRLDEAGLWLLGRAANAVHGLRPFEVELAVERLDWVRHAALSRAEDSMGTRAILTVEPRHGVGLRRDRLLAEVRALVAEHGWPIDEVVVRSKLPRLGGHAAKPGHVTRHRPT